MYRARQSSFESSNIYPELVPSINIEKIPTFLLHPLLNPEARNPPNGPMTLHRRQMMKAWAAKGEARAV